MSLWSSSSSSSSCPHSTLPADCEVVIVGGGVSGASAALHLIRAGVQNVVLIESGSPGNGSSSPTPYPDKRSFRDGDEEVGGVFNFARHSGSACLPDPSGTVKMILNLYGSTTAEFIHHHGEDGARRYLSLAREGIRIETELAQQSLRDFSSNFRRLGTIYLAKEDDLKEFREEFELLQRVGAEGVEWFDRDKVVEMIGFTDAHYEAGIFFPHDAIINSGLFCQDLLDLAVREGQDKVTPATGSGRLRMFSGLTVTAIDHGSKDGSEDSYAYTHLQGGLKVRSKFVIVATGGLFVEPTIGGILKPCWSYLVGIKDPLCSSDDVVSESTSLDAYNSSKFLGRAHSLNVLTWGFTHDWCLTHGYMRISGEDHFSAYKPPRMAERCKALATWAYARYPHLLPAGETEGPYTEQYGVYTETPDAVPLVGTPHAQSRVCYLLGCNAVGQAALSYAASLVPGMLGYTELTASQRDNLKLLTIRRFALLPVVQNR